jgi:hypothetical protein
VRDDVIVIDKDSNPVLSKVHGDHAVFGDDLTVHINQAVNEFATGVSVHAQTFLPRSVLGRHANHGSCDSIGLLLSFTQRKRRWWSKLYYTTSEEHGFVNNTPKHKSTHRFLCLVIDIDKRNHNSCNQEQNRSEGCCGNHGEEEVQQGEEGSNQKGVLLEGSSDPTDELVEIKEKKEPHDCARVHVSSGVWNRFKELDN